LVDTVLKIAELKNVKGNFSLIIILLPEFNKIVKKFVDLIFQLKITDNIQESQIDFGALRILHKNQSFFKS
jgi:hypothetical protein